MIFGVTHKYELRVSFNNIFSQINILLFLTKYYFFNLLLFF